MKKLHLMLLVIAVLMLSLMVLVPAAQAGTLYVGQADLYDGVADGSFLGSSTFANDLLVVTLNGSVLTQSTRGMFPGGSKMNWTYRWIASGNEWVMISSWGIVKYNELPPAVRVTVL